MSSDVVILPEGAVRSPIAHNVAASTGAIARKPAPSPYMFQPESLRGSRQTCCKIAVDIDHDRFAVAVNVLEGGDGGRCRGADQDAGRLQVVLHQL